MTDPYEGRGPVSRILIALVIYGLVAVGAWLLIPIVQRTFLLPPLFGTLSRGALGLGVLFVAFFAWRYPELGDSDPPLP